jgi:hypothetical protein
MLPFHIDPGGHHIHPMTFRPGPPVESLGLPLLGRQLRRRHRADPGRGRALAQPGRRLLDSPGPQEHRCRDHLGLLLALATANRKLVREAALIAGERRDARSC